MNFLRLYFAGAAGMFVGLLHDTITESHKKEPDQISQHFWMERVACAAIVSIVWLPVALSYVYNSVRVCIQVRHRLSLA